MWIQTFLCFFAGCTSVADPPSVSKSGALLASEAVVATRGFVNMGNTCYFNAILQVLVHSKSVRDTFDSFLIPKDESQLSHGEMIHNEFGLLVRRQWNVSGKFQQVAIRPSRLFALLKQSDATLFRIGIQQDAHEALMSLLAAIEIPLELSLINLFKFEVMSIMVCQSCQTIPEPKVTVENQVIIPLENNENIYSITWGVGERFAPEYLDGVRCSGCEGEVQLATRVNAVATHPKLLLVVIQRSNAFGQKIHTRVLLDKRLKFGLGVYKLIGVVHHVGNSVNSGHYTADFYHFEDNNWYHADDNTVQRLRLSHWVSRTAYILLYELI